MKEGSSSKERGESLSKTNCHTILFLKIFNKSIDDVILKWYAVIASETTSTIKKGKYETKR